MFSLYSNKVNSKRLPYCIPSYHFSLISSCFISFSQSPPFPSYDLRPTLRPLLPFSIDKSPILFQVINRIKATFRGIPWPVIDRLTDGLTDGLTASALWARRFLIFPVLQLKTPTDGVFLLNAIYCTVIASQKRLYRYLRAPKELFGLLFSFISSFFLSRSFFFYFLY